MTPSSVYRHEISFSRTFQCATTYTRKRDTIIPKQKSKEEESSFEENGIENENHNRLFEWNKTTTVVRVDI